MTSKMLIEDERLTPNLKRARNGHKQEFRSNDGNVKFTLTHDERHFYAELINQQWFWVNGCEECNGEEPNYCYVKCVEHDVCVDCKLQRVSATQPHWGCSNGFRCNKCQDVIDKKHKEKIQETINSFEYDKWDFYCLDEITCPYCKSTVEDNEDNYDAHRKTYDCEECENNFTLTAEHTVSWTSTR